MPRSFSFVLLVLAATPCGAWGAHAPQEKSQYNLFHPVPRELMREFNTDRPSATDSPYTVDAGHFQYEADLVSYARNRAENGAVTQLWSFNSVNLRTGLTNELELQLLLPTYNIQTVDDGSPLSRGYGDTRLRLKYNIFGNDGGAIAMGLIPYVKLPTAAERIGNKRVAGGVSVPFALSLPTGWSSGFMVVFSKSKNQADDHFHSEFDTSWDLEHNLFSEQLEGYVEIFSRTRNESGAGWIATFDLGLIYSLSANLKIDTGANIGLTSAANGYNPFVGLSYRY
jgi:hypothetical protein